MKHTKRLASILLALVMALALMVPAMAEEETYTLTIDNSVEGYTYVAYQIFTGDLKVTNAGTADETKVLSNIVWGNGVTEEGKVALLMFGKAADTAPYASPAALAEALTESNVQDFAEEAGKYLSTSAGSSAYTDGKYLIAGLEPGYYLVKNTAVPDPENTDDTTYTNYILEIVANTTVQHKGTYPTVDKNIGTVSTINVAVNGADYNIGDDVPFTLTATLPENLSTYETYQVIFHDTLPAGLTYNADSAKVYVINGGTTTEVKSGYTVTAEDNILTVSIGDVYALKTEGNVVIGVDMSSKIVVEYTAKLNAGADIGQPGNKNEVYLEYSNDPNWNGTGEEPTGNTPKDEVVVFTYELDVTKVDGKDTAKNLEGAEFVLYRTVSKTVEGNATTVNEYVIVAPNGTVTGWTENAHDSDETSKASVLKSDADGLFKVIGLDAGTYYLEEIKAPSGYNLLKDPVALQITAMISVNSKPATLDTLTITVDGTKANGNEASGIVSTDVTNNAGATLPETGGMGTTIFYAVGAILVLGAVILLVTKKRMSRER